MDAVRCEWCMKVCGIGRDIFMKLDNVVIELSCISADDLFIGFYGRTWGLLHQVHNLDFLKIFMYCVSQTSCKHLSNKIKQSFIRFRTSI